MDQQKRLFLTFGLTMALVLVWQFFLTPQVAPPVGAVDGGAVATAPADAGTQVAQAPGAGEGGVAPGEAAAPAEPAAPVLTVERNFDGYIEYDVSTRGAALTQAKLLGPKMREQGDISFVEGFKRLTGKELKQPPQMDLAAPPTQGPSSFSVSVEGPAGLPADLVYRVDESASNERKLVLTAAHGVWEITKTYEWNHPTPLEVDLTVTLRNRSEQAQSGELGVNVVRQVDPTKEEKPSFFGAVGNQSRAACFVEEELYTLLPEQDPPDEPMKGALRFFGIDQQYFLAALYPADSAQPARCELFAAPTTRRASAFFPLQVGAGETRSFRFGGYMGPKDVEILAAVPGVARIGPGGEQASNVSAKEAQAGSAPDAYRPQLERTVDFGIWAVLCNLLLAVMKKFEAMTGNWGIAVILLTVLVKILVLPLTHKSMVAAENMKKLQPKMEEIRKKFADDRQRQQMEQMKLFQEAKVNPLGGCFPILIQMPIWIALFTTLRNSYELYREPFFAPFITDLTYKDPTYLLPLLLGVTMIVTQKLQPQMMDATQARIMTWFMPIFFTAIMLNYPAGLTLYIFTNNVLSIAQTYGLRKWLEHKGVSTPVPATSGRKG